MKRITPWLVPLAALLCVTFAHAAGMDKSNVVRDYTDTIAPAEQLAYEAGVKNYNQCLHQHGFKFNWTAWAHETGNTYMYSYDSDPLTWADFDAMHSTGKACDAIWDSEVNPHLISETSAFMTVMPELSHMPKGMDVGSGLIEVTYFKLKSGHKAQEAFTNGAKMIARAAEKSNWPGHYGFSAVQDAGPDAPDFVLVWPSRNWADFGQDINPSLWKMVEGVYGKKKTDTLRKSLNWAIEDTSSHLDRYNSDLTYTPSK